MTFSSCTFVFNDPVDGMVDALEESNKVFIDSNLKVYADIKSAKVADSNIVLKSDSLQYANEGVNSLIDQFKEEITNLTLIGKGTEHAQAIFSVVYSFAALNYAVSNVDKRTSVVMINSSVKGTLDSVLVTIRSMQKDSLWVKKHIEGTRKNQIILVLSELQISSSHATNLALTELRSQLYQK